ERRRLERAAAHRPLDRTDEQGNEQGHAAEEILDAPQRLVQDRRADQPERERRRRADDRPRLGRRLAVQGLVDLHERKDRRADVADDVAAPAEDVPRRAVEMEPGKGGGQHGGSGRQGADARRRGEARGRSAAGRRDRRRVDVAASLDELLAEQRREIAGRRVAVRLGGVGLVGGGRGMRLGRGRQLGGELRRLDLRESVLRRRRDGGGGGLGGRDGLVRLGGGRGRRGRRGGRRSLVMQRRERRREQRRVRREREAAGQ